MPMVKAWAHSIALLTLLGIAQRGVAQEASPDAELVDEPAPFDEPAGAVGENGLVFGCYMHGLFDHPAFRSALWRWLCDCKSIPPDSVSANDMNLSLQLDRLADVLEENVRWDVCREVAS